MISFRHLGRYGRLGNQLFQLASTLGIATRRGERAAFPYWRYRPYFSVPDEHFPDLAGLRTEDLGREYLQDVSLFEEIAERIRRYLAPPPELAERLQARNAQRFGLEGHTAVHVRRGDYLRHPEAFRVLRMSYYEEAMSRCEPPFAVFSDDLTWCRDHFPADCLFVTGNLDYEDLHLMSMCRAFVISNSTFAWWPAWLAAAPTFAPAHWFGPRPTEVEQRLLPDEWVLLPG